MKLHKLFFFSVLILALALGACSPAASDEARMNQATEAMMDEPTEEMMEATESMMDEPTEEMMESTEAVMDSSATPAGMAHGTGTPEPMMDEPTEEMAAGDGTPEAMMETPSWLGAELTNVATGEAFTLDDYQGKVVLVELMAQWCSTCLRQQQQVVALHARLGMDSDLVTVALDIDPNEDAATLKDYAAGHSFNWIYAVAPADVAREIGNLYGAQFLNPPSAPMLLIDRSGEVHPLPFGVKSADELHDAIQPFLDEEM